MMQGYGYNFRAPKVDIHKFSMVPRAEIPRSSFLMSHQHKTTFSASQLIPVFVQEVLPGDSWSVQMTAFCRMATPLFPLMDNMDLESWFFFVPCRILWSHWTNFMGEQPSTPSDSISFTVPTVTSPANGFANFSVYDYMGLPGVGMVNVAATTTVNVLPLRAYNIIWSQWFRDENLQNAVGTGATFTVGDIGDGPDPSTNYVLLNAQKRHDYFTSCLPWTQKGGVAVTLPLGSSATVKTSGTELFTSASNIPAFWRRSDNSQLATQVGIVTGATNTPSIIGPNTTAAATAPSLAIYPSNLYADLSTATAATINQLRLAFQTQKLLERDARAGTRYQELVFSHFGVMGADARYQRPEYLGGGRTPVNIAPVPQTISASFSGTSNPPLGTLAGVGTLVSRNHGFRQSFTEHGYILGLTSVRADPVYQQGCRRMWTRSTRYDFYFPVFAMLGEQAVRNDEIYQTGAMPQDSNTFGFQEHWAEYRYFPSQVSGYFRATTSGTLDAWHLAEQFTSLPALNSTFITDKTANTLARNLAAGAAANQQQFLADFLFQCKVARPMPLYSVPGLIDHF